MKAGWDKLYSTITGAVGGETVVTFVSVIGVAIMVVMLLGWLVGKVRSKGGGSQGVSNAQLAWAILIGGVLSSLKVAVPIVLAVFEVIVKLFLAFLKLFGG